MRWRRRKAREEDLERELRSDLELEAEEHREKGRSPEEARRAAQRAFGNTTLVMEDVRAVWVWLWLEQFAQDLRYGLRMLRRSPAFTAVAVLSLALGIGANAAVFTLVNAVLLRMLPVTNPQELVGVTAVQRGAPGIISYPMYRDLRDRQQVFTDILASAGETPYRITIPGPGGQQSELDNMRVSFVSGNYFTVLGVQAAIGRFFHPEEDRNANTSETSGSVVVLNHGFWESQFGGDVGVIGRTILIGRSPCQVIGVAPRGFSGEAVGAAAAAWVPLVPFSSPDELDNRRGAFTAEIGRLKPGMSREQAQSSLTALFQQLLLAEGRTGSRVSDNAISLESGATGLDYGLRRRFGKPLRIIMAIVAVVLLIACANLANLLLARAASRRGQIGVRLAIGCSRGRLIRQLLTESMLLSLLGAAAGAALASWGSNALVRMVSFGPVPIQLDLTPDARVVLFLAGLGVLTGMVFGFAPALRTTRVDLVPSLKGTLRGAVAAPAKQRLTRMLLVAQVALSLLLLVGAGLLIHSVQNLHHLDWGFRPEHVLILDLAHNPLRRDPDSLAQTAHQVMERVRQVPGVDSSSVSGLLLFSPSDISAPLAISGYTPGADERVMARFNCVSPGYFQTVGMTLAEGRGLEDRDGPNAPRVAVINQAMERRYFHGASAVGRSMTITAGPLAQRKPIEVVGVVKDSKYNNLREDAKPLFYLPIEQLPRTLRSLEVRTSRPLREISGQIRQALAAASREVMVRRVVTLSDQVDQSLAGEEIVMKLCTVFGALSLLLACVGLYGVMSYSMTQRTSEIGIRMALGATRPDVLWLMLRETMVVVVAGLLTGFPLAIASSRLVSTFLYDLSATDPLTLSIAICLLVAASVLAGLLPARRAARVDPMVALRYE